MSPRKLLGLLGALGLSLAGCPSGSGPNNRDSGVLVHGGVITGHVLEMGARSPMAGATVTLGERTTQTNEQGWYFFSEVPSAGQVVLRAAAADYLPGLATASVSDGAMLHVDLALVPVGTTRTLQAGTGGTVSAGQGAQVVFPANAFVTAQGAPVTGAVQVTLTTLDPTTESGLAAFPGDFVGTQSDGAYTPLESFGVADITARQGDAVLALAPGARATVVLPVPASTASRAPQTIGWWSLDEASGGWAYEGTAAREASTAAPSGLAYRAAVTHLSWWNLDVAYRNQTTCLRVCVVDANGARVRAARVEAVGLDYTARASAYTGSDGCAEINVKTNSRVRLTPYVGNEPGTAAEVSTPGTVAFAGATPSECTPVDDLLASRLVAQFVLSWGERPSDLDSHFTGPDPAGGATPFHVYYARRGALSASPFAMLDTDDTSGHGPEIVSVSRVTTGRYRYSVHNFSGQGSGALESSGATVTVVVPDLGGVWRFTVPASNPGSADVWRVLDLVAENGRVVRAEPINDIVSSAGGTAFMP